ncbi:MAG: phosphate ABC transporter permease subunit PstC [Candidatus Omnitrophica bacterium]|nr:phosphate ABC transporter permease subunit PstC [Candidatus Omnitrophota bacterium]
MRYRQLKDQIARRVVSLFCLFTVSLLVMMVFGLYERAKPVFHAGRLGELLFSSDWHPAQGKFGLASFLAGTFWVTAIAMVMAVPMSVLTATFLAEYCPRKIRERLKPVIDLLAGISPVIYGVWGVIVIVPFVRDIVMPFLSERLPFFPFASDNYTGFGALTAGIVLAVMVAPLMIAVIEEIMETVPLGMKESSMALGATRWQTTQRVILKKAGPGILAAVILGLSRALGETMAVLMVAGCAMGVFPKSIFDAAYPLPALIANTYGEMMSVPLYDAAILLAAFVLLVVTVLFNMAAWGILLYMEAKEA